MKRLLLLLAVITLISCKKENRETVNKKEVPEALQEKKIFRKSAMGNLVEELYQELVSKSTELQQLESEIENLKPKEAQEEFYNYNSKLLDYYSMAKHEATTIRDSATKKKILAFIEKSNTGYLEKSKELDNLVKTIQDKQNAIEDSHTVLKIILTMPVIVKYQNQNLPEKTKLKNMIRREDSLVKKIQSQTPQY